MEKAFRFLDEAKKMVDMQLWLQNGFSAHTHEGTMALFGLHFVKTHKVDVSLGSFFSRMEQLRKKADYNCNYDVSEYEVMTMIQPAQTFVDKISKLVEVGG